MDAIKNLINWLSGPTVLFTLATVGFLVSLRYPKVWSKRNAIVVFGVMAIFYFVSMFDPNYFLIVAKPDNVPITFVLYGVAFFTWFAMHQGVENDKRIAEGQQPLEKQGRTRSGSGPTWSTWSSSA
jgi:hypothetical protein